MHVHHSGDDTFQPNGLETKDENPVAMVVHTIPPGMLFFQIVWHVHHNSGNIMDCIRTWHKEMGEHDLSRTCGLHLPNN